MANPEETLVIVCSVVDMKGLALVLSHMDLKEFYIKSAEAFRFLE